MSVCQECFCNQHLTRRKGRVDVDRYTVESDEALANADFFATALIVL